MFRVPTLVAGGGPVRQCTGCGEVLSLEGFHRQKGAADGRRSRCRACVAQLNVEWRARNAGEIKSKAAAYRATPEHRERARQVTAAWKQRRKDKR